MASELEKAVTRYRAEVDRGEQETLLDLARLWGKSRGAMQEWIDALIRRINDDGGEWDGYLNSLYRFEMMREQARKIIDGYMADVFRVVGKKIRTNVTLGLGNAKKLIEIMTGNDPAMNLKTGTAMDAEEIMAALTREGSPFDRLMRKDYSDEVTEAIRDVLTRGVAMGSGWEQVAKEMTEVSDMTFDRAKRIARTEMNRALRQSTLEGYRASGVVKAYRRMCYKETACFACLMMDGELYDLEMDFSDHPNGKCTIIPVLDRNEKPDWETGREWFEKLDPEEQKRLMGKTRFELWQEGQIGDLRDLVELKPNDIWGSSPSMIPLRGLELGTSGTRNFAMGLRKDNFHILSDEEIDSLKQDIAAIQADINVFRFNKGYNTGYKDKEDIIYVRGDILPDNNSIIARDKMSTRAVLAHEYYGHRANKGTRLPNGSWNDEFRASYMAAKNAPGLSDTDRYYLIQDAIDRAADAGVTINPNKFMIQILYGDRYE